MKTRIATGAGLLLALALGADRAPAGVDLLTNEEVIAVDQASSRNREVLAEGTAVAWAADAPGGGTYVALFNRGDAAAKVEVPLGKLGLTGAHSVRDLWARAPRC